MTVRILHGDCRQVLRTLPDDSVHCCVTSPPYWGLRSYLPANHPDKPLEIGSEPTLQAWVDTMVEVFREVRRVLRPDGTLWLNLGDAYASNAGGYSDTGSRGTTSCPRISAGTMAAVQSGRARIPAAGLKPKDLMGQPWRVAFALQDDGWWLRQEVIWSKPNPMPESVRDRCTKAHEHVFLLSKSEQYFYDFDAMQEPVNGGAHARRPGNKSHKHTAAYEAGDEKLRTKAGLVAYAERMREKEVARSATPNVGRREGPPGNPAERKLAAAGSGIKSNTSMGAAFADLVDTRNPRSVWEIPTHAFKGAHFATFPPALAARCITAGCPVGGVVLDPFGGSGTVGMVADGQHKDAILIDLDERNVPMATDRIRGDSPLFAEVS